MEAICWVMKSIWLWVKTHLVNLKLAGKWMLLVLFGSTNPYVAQTFWWVAVVRSRHGLGLLHLEATLFECEPKGPSSAKKFDSAPVRCLFFF